MVKVLFIGDVVSNPGLEAVRKVLPNLKKENGVNLTIANAENSAVFNGVSKESAKALFESGCDVLTGGNHSLKNRSVFELFNGNSFILRPANISCFSPGRGFCVFKAENFSIAIINLLGQVYLDANSSPFETVNWLLKKIDTKLIFIDFHAEATGEKGALAHYLDGRVSAIAGTHTHVQTNDARILEGGTGFISDVGMVGPYFDSVLGVKSSCVIRRITTKLPTKFEVKAGTCIFNAVIFSFNKQNGKCIEIEPISLKC